MTMVQQLLVVCAVAIVVAVVMVLVLEAFGLKENVAVIAAVSASVSSTVVMTQLQAKRRREAAENKAD